MIATHNISDISFRQNNISLSIDGKTIELPLDKVSKKLKDASELQRKFFKVLTFRSEDASGHSNESVQGCDGHQYVIRYLQAVATILVDKGLVFFGQFSKLLGGWYNFIQPHKSFI